MAFEEGGQSVCIDEEVALDFVRGRLPEPVVERIDEHVDRCDRCRGMLLEATRSFRERTTADTGPPGVPFTRFAAGDLLAGRYRILRFIARGGMGEVYEARDLILNAGIALKTLAATISDDPHAIRRLKQEVNLARRITHPNVCRIFDLGVHEQGGAPAAAAQGQLFITMELVAGRSLGECLRKEGRMDAARAAPIVHGMVAAISAAHRANVVHRDFKSDNVMLAPDESGGERVVVMDFGLARAARAGETSSIDGPSLAGTLPYMAPEQLEGKTPGPAADIYALGVVMFEMLTGQLPFKGQPPLAAALKRMVEPPPELASFVTELDPGWQRAVSACLERDPTRRPGSADEIEQRLRTVVVASSVHPQRLGRAGGARRNGRRALVTAGVVAGLLVVLSAAALVVARVSRRGAAGPDRQTATAALGSASTAADARSGGTSPANLATANIALPAVPATSGGPRHVNGEGPGPQAIPEAPKRRSLVAEPRLGLLPRTRPQKEQIRVKASPASLGLATRESASSIAASATPAGLEASSPPAPASLDRDAPLPVPPSQDPDRGFILP